MTFGTLVINVKEAKLQRDTELIGKMDPFVEFHIGEFNPQTKIHESAGNIK